MVPCLGCSPSRTDCVPHRIIDDASKHAPVWDPLSRWPQVMPGACQAQASQEVTAPFGHLPALSWGPPGALGDLSSGIWSTSSLFLHYLVSTGQCLAHIFTPSTAVLQKVDFFLVLFSNLLSQRCFHRHRLLCLSQCHICLGAGWHWLCQTRGKILAASHRSCHCNPTATKSLPCKPSGLSYMLC